ncbi:hypothetical protein [Fusobacterium ulcerans]|uniref:hypothetical protein n=1 Tax=Fusobacterium ulcerans TaxID=861 RepID=UPI0010319843|nr:hypothetical protein [Fusobacterium ulcerans]
MERKIGEIFESNNKTKIKCVRGATDYCYGCLYWFASNCLSPDIAGECQKHLRSDREDVIFIEVKE